MKFSFNFLPLGLLFVSTASVVTGEEFGKTDEYDAIENEGGICDGANQPSGSCPQKMSCGFDNMKLQCRCSGDAGAQWECDENWVNMPTSPPAPTPTPQPSCDGTASGCAMGEAYFVYKDNEVDGDLGILDVGDVAESSATVATKASMLLAAGAVAALL